MTDRNAPYRIVAAVDFCEVCDHAVQHALRLSGRDPEAEVHVVHVIEPGESGATRSVRIRNQDVLLDRLPERLSDYVRDQAEALGSDGQTGVGLHVRIGEPVQSILQLAADIDAQLIVAGTHGRSGLQRWRLGSVAEELVRTAHCPVLVARPADHEGVQRSDRIEAPCPQCLEVRTATEGRQWWCDEHAKKREPSHVYSGATAVHWSRGAAEVHGMGHPESAW